MILDLVGLYYHTIYTCNIDIIRYNHSLLCPSEGNVVVSFYILLTLLN